MKLFKLSYHSFTKGHLVNKTKSQSGFAHLAIIIVLLVALLGALGYIYWQNFMQPKTNSTSNSSQETTTPTTKVTDPTADWETYTDSVAGFSFKYPASFTVYNSTDNPAWNTEDGTNKLTVTAFKITDYGNNFGLGPDLDQVKDKGDISKAISTLDASPISSIAINNNLSVKKIGSTNFIRIFPGSGEGCFCYTLNYVTVVNDNFVEISSHIATTKSNMTEDQFQAAYKSNATNLIKDMYGDVETVLATFNKS